MDTRDYLENKYEGRVRIRVESLYLEIQCEEEEMKIVDLYLNEYYNDYSLDKDTFIDIAVDIIDNGCENIAERTAIKIQDIKTREKPERVVRLERIAARKADAILSKIKKPRPFKYKLYRDEEYVSSHRFYEEIGDLLGLKKNYVSNRCCKFGGKLGYGYKVIKIKDL